MHQLKKSSCCWNNVQSFLPEVPYIKRISAFGQSLCKSKSRLSYDCFKILNTKVSMHIALVLDRHVKLRTRREDLLKATPNLLNVDFFVCSP